MSNRSSLSKLLSERLRSRIETKGPITFHDWMEAALYDSECGYYCRADLKRWGREGDYRTSPEITPLFAATFACYFADLYQQLGRPARWFIVETGAGDGSFAEGVLRTLEQEFPSVSTATHYIVDEFSGSSKPVLKERLARFGNRVSLSSLNEISNGETGIVFSNELLDAFPVHRVVMEEGSLREMYVTLDGKGHFSWSTGPLSTPQLSDYFDLVGMQLTSEGQVAEVNLGIWTWLERVAEFLNSGYVISVDYGEEGPNLFAPERRQGTVRAFRQHQFQDVLHDPGENDITSTIDWTYVRKVGEKFGLTTERLLRLDRFLLEAGILEQLERMVGEAEDEATKVSLRTSAREMIFPNAMAASFQVAIQRKD